MLRTANILLSIRISQAANRLIYYAQRIPLIGRAIPDKLYAGLDGKHVLTVLAWVVMIAQGLLSRLFYLGFMVYLPLFLWQDAAPADRLQLFLHIFLLISFIAAGVTNTQVLTPSREKYTAVKLMRMLPTDYMKVSLAYRYITYFAFYVPVLILFVALLDASLWRGVSLALAVTLWRVCCEYLHLKLFERTGMALVRNNPINWSIIAITFIGAYTPLLFHEMPLIGGVLLHGGTTAVIVILGLIAAWQLARYPDYRSAVDAASKRDDPLLDLEQLVVQTHKATLASKESDYAPTDAQSDPVARKKDYAYLNALFFRRHRSLINSPVYKRLAILAGLTFVGAILILFMKPEHASIITTFAANPYPYLPLAVSFLAIGERICMAMYYHCDGSLMRYSFYRKAAGHHYRLRLKRLVGFNLMIGGTLALALTLLLLLSQQLPAAAELLLLWAYTLSLALFFSIHHLFMYYILQPFTTDLNVKNPFYLIITSFVSFLCGISLFLRASAASFTTVAVTVTCIYFVVSLLLVHRFGHRTFRVK